MRDARSFADPVPRGRTVVVAVWAWLAIEMLAGLSSLLLFLQLAAHQPGEPMTDSIAPAGTGASVIVNDLAAGFQFLALLIVGIMILRWIHRVVANTHVMSSGLTVSPGWAVGWYFIPVGNLWKPFVAVREAWQVSQSPDDWQHVAVPGLLRWWWGLWLTSNVLGNASFRLNLHATTVGDHLSSLVVDIVSAIVSIPLALTLMAVVRRLSAEQLRAYQARTFA